MSSFEERLRAVILELRRQSRPREFLGFHGTARDSALGIIECKRFEISRNDENWLGDGIYFWEDVCQNAEWWCRYRRIPVPAIIECRITVKEVFDLYDPNVKRFLDSVLTLLTKRNSGTKYSHVQIADGHAINYIFQNFWRFEAVRCRFFYRKKYSKYKKSRIIGEWRAILCVRNPGSVSVENILEVC